MNDKKGKTTIYAQDGQVPRRAPPQPVIAQKPKPAPKTNK